MQPSEAVHPKAPTSIHFPIDQLPADIIHIICVFLRPSELANLRLVSRNVGPISFKYMVPEVHLMLTKDSYERLKAIAAHPIASKNVTSFFFEADRLSEWPLETWDQCFRNPEYVPYSKKLGSPGQWCDYDNDGSSWISVNGTPIVVGKPCHHCTEEKRYAELLRFQEEMHPDVTEMAEAMKRFPRLNELTMTIGDCGQSRASTLRKIFQPGLVNYCEVDNTPELRVEPLGLQQMRSLLLGVYFAGLKVETLQCGLLDWQIFGQPSETFARMRDSVANVKNLRLELDVGGAVARGDPCWTKSSTGDLERRLGDSITAASKLEHLQLNFPRKYCTSRTSLENILGEHRWPCLKSINLKNIGTTEDELVAFCSRHADTLTSVHLADIGFLEGDWMDALSRMRKILTLDALVLRGILESPSQKLHGLEYTEQYWPRYRRVLEEWFLRARPGAEKELADFMACYALEAEAHHFP